MEWVESDRLSAFSMPAADLPIITAINLPDRYVVTGPDPKEPEQFIKKLQTTLNSGLRLVQLRVGAMPERELLSLGSR